MVEWSEVEESGSQIRGREVLGDKSREQIHPTGGPFHWRSSRNGLISSRSEVVARSLKHQRSRESRGGGARGCERIRGFYWSIDDG
jgi:hypothetical protein